MEPVSPQYVRPWLPKSSPPSYRFTGARILDVVSGKIFPNSSILLSNGLIQTVALSRAPPRPPPDTIELNLQGAYIIPGLIDCHVHLAAVPGSTSLSSILSTPSDPALLRMTHVLRQILCRGFTTVRDCGGAPSALKSAIAECLLPGPRLFIAGHALSQTGGHGDFRSPHDHSHPDYCAGSFVSSLGRVCDGVPACLAAAREELRCGADFLKIMCGGGVVSPSDKLENLQFSPEEMRAVVDVAGRAGTWVTARAYTPQAMRTAVECGVRGVEHGNFLDRSTAELMKEKGTWLTPTLVAYEMMGDPALPQILPEEAKGKNEKVLAEGLGALRVAKDVGVKMCYGSDLLGPLGRYQAKEFAIRAQVLEPLDVLQSATVNGAEMLGLSDLGQVKEGFKADLLILKSNPLEDVGLFEREEEILAVIKDGRVWRSRMPELSGILDKLEEL